MLQIWTMGSWWRAIAFLVVFWGFRCNVHFHRFRHHVFCHGLVHDEFVFDFMSCSPFSFAWRLGCGFRAFHVLLFSRSRLYGIWYACLFQMFMVLWLWTSSWSLSIFAASWMLSSVWSSLWCMTLRTHHGTVFWSWKLVWGLKYVFSFLMVAVRVNCSASLLSLCELYSMIVFIRALSFLCLYFYDSFIAFSDREV